MLASIAYYSAYAIEASICSSNSDLAAYSRHAARVSICTFVPVKQVKRGEEHVLSPNSSSIPRLSSSKVLAY
jgi:hypothetical protein